MKKQTPLSIVFKLCALVSFCGLIGGGGYLAYDNLMQDNWLWFGLGCGLAAIGLFLTALFVTLFSRLDKQEDFADKPVSHCFKGAGLFTVIAASVIFLGIGVFLWIDRGFLVLGVASIVTFIIMIAGALVVSFFYQMAPMRKLRTAAQAAELTGTVKGVRAKWSLVIFKSAVLIWQYTIEADGITSVAYCSWRDPLRQEIKPNDQVVIKIDLSDPKYCLMVRRHIPPKQQSETAQER